MHNHVFTFRRWGSITGTTETMADTQHLSYVDYIVFGLSLLISLGIGAYFSRAGGKQRTVDEYLMGNRQISCLPIALSLLVTFQSGISLLGLPVEIYYYGTQIYLGVVGLVIAYVLVTIFIVPVLHPLHLNSVYEYLEMRFQSKSVRLIGCILGLLLTITYMAVVLFLPGLALQSVTGFPAWISVIVIASVVVLYTIMGGIKAVVWTDVFQFVVMIAGIVTLLIKGCIAVGGPKSVWDAALSENRIQFFNLDPDPTVRQTFWAVTIGTITSWIGNALSQSGIQRICSTPTVREARKAVLFNLPAALLLETLMACLGLTIFAYYSTNNCDPHSTNKIQSQNQLVPYFVMEQLSFLPGLGGLFLACLFSATLSTLSSGLGAISAIVWEDILQTYFPKIPMSKGTTISRIIVAVFGAIVVGLSFLAMNLKGTITQIAIGSLSATSGPLVGVYLLGMIFPWATPKSAIISGALSFGICLAMTLGSNVYPSPQTSQLNVSFTGCLDNTTLSLNNTNSNITQLAEVYNQNFTSNETVFWSTTRPSYDMTSGNMTLDNMTLDNTTLISSVLGNSVPWIFQVSFLWYHTIGVLVTFILGIIISIISGGLSDVPSEPRFLLEVVRNSNCYRNKLRIKIKQPTSDYLDLRSSFRNKNQSYDFMKAVQAKEKR